MFKKSIVLFSVFMMFSLVSAAEKGGKKFSKFAPPPIVINVAKEKPQVISTGEFSSLPVSAESKNKAPSSSSAALLTERDKQFTWLPSPQYSSTIRNADLTGAALSEDGTLAVITERIGGENKPNSTRFVLFNIPEQRIAGGFIIKEALIDSAVFIPGSKSEMIAIRRPSVFFNTGCALVRISLSNREIMDYTESSEQEFTSFAFGENGEIFSTVAASGDILVYDSENLSKKPRKIKSRLQTPAVTFTGKELLAYGREGVEIFRRRGNYWSSGESFFKGPSDFTPHKALLTEPSVPALCFAGKFEEDCWYFRKDAFKKIKKRVSGIQTWDGKRKLFFTVLAANAQISVFQMPEAAEAPKTVSPNRLKPANRNHCFALLRVPALKDKMIQVDTRGNVFVLDYTKMGRWKKHAVYIADRAGFRK